MKTFHPKKCCICGKLKSWEMFKAIKLSNGSMILSDRCKECTDYVKVHLVCNAEFDKKLRDKLIPDGMKRCPKCKELKVLGEFNKSKRDGHTSHCRECIHKAYALKIENNIGVRAIKSNKWLQQKEIIIDKINKGMSCTDIAIEYGVTFQTMSHTLFKLGINLRELKKTISINAAAKKKESALAMRELKNIINKNNKPIIRRWKNMKQRCSNPKHHQYKDYGGRGITVCDEWINDSKAFVTWCKLNGYDAKLQIDRIDNDGNYGPDNCRFVTAMVNNNNKRPRNRG